MMGSPPIVEVKDLHKVYRVGIRRKKFVGVKGVSFEVYPGEIFGIVGPNGAGKTSTIKILTGLMKPTSGYARMFGEPVDDIESRRRLGYLPEGPYFYEHLKAPELLRYYGQLHGLDSATMDKRIPELIARVGLSHATDRPLKKFSKGMRQRAGLAQALINNPELVILDEPQSGLDPVGRKEVRDLIFELKQQGKTVIFSSHILPDVEAVCDRVALFHKGEIKEIGSLDELMSRRTKGFEVITSGLKEDDLRQLTGLQHTAQRGELWELEFGADLDMAQAINEIVKSGGNIQSIRPLRDNLEQVFLRDTTDEEE